jgi:hypothetical protein
VNKDWTFVNQAGVNLDHIGTCFNFANRIVATENAAHTNDGELRAQMLPKQTNDAVAAGQYRGTRKPAHFVAVGHAFDRLARQGGVGGNDAVHLMF